MPPPNCHSVEGMVKCCQLWLARPATIQLLVWLAQLAKAMNFSPLMSMEGQQWSQCC
jgi:hypothetical protein